MRIHRHVVKFKMKKQTKFLDWCNCLLVKESIGQQATYKKMMINKILPRTLLVYSDYENHLQFYFCCSGIFVMQQIQQNWLFR
ncbi:unnamed protein product [Paramecium octaurelia]|uniref:Uncharacterized protein n=1 Tax=Paramecium octaurelia TaxID=43137 RepID=A0A8S1T0T4_PAROT|nr:unnamed protein product [Paramecium octaurelia]